MNVLREQRSTGRVEFRADGASLRLEGYASVTGHPYEVNDWLGSYTETIAPGAFRSCLGDDCVLVVNHDSTSIPLARTRSGTLTLDEDGTGLRVSAELDAQSPQVAALRSAMERGDLDQMSFAFTVAAQRWNGDYTDRTIDEIGELFDVSVVTFPASDATSVSLTSRSAMALRGIRQLREGRVLSDANLAALQDALTALDAADEAVDTATEQVAQVVGAANDDSDDDTATPDDDGTTGSLSLSRTFAEARQTQLRLRARRSA